MSLLSKLADRLILCPTKTPIPVDDKRRETISFGDGIAEVWVGEAFNGANHQPSLVVLKFPGAAGRAERSTLHPAENWHDLRSEVWTVNPPGYGGSDGSASMAELPNFAATVFNYLVDSYPDALRLVAGNSLGCLSALYLAARFELHGLLLRNPPPIHQLISTRPRYAAWNFGWSRLIAAQIPRSLDAVDNARKSRAPCLFVQSQKDRVVPIRYQSLITNVYRGPQRVFQILNADHHEPIDKGQSKEYLAALNWLRTEFFQVGAG